MILTFEEYMAKRILTEDGHHFTDQEIKMLVREGFLDGVKKWGGGAALTGAMAAAGMGMMGGGGGGNNDMSQRPAATQNAAPSTMQIKKMFDDNAIEGKAMTPQQWMQLADQYPASGNGVGFIPSPKKYNQWIPAGGADSVHVQSRTQVRNDELESDDVGLTPWKDGKAMGKTNWTDMAH